MSAALGNRRRMLPPVRYPRSSATRAVVMPRCRAIAIRHAVRTSIPSLSSRTSHKAMSSAVTDAGSSSLCSTSRAFALDTRSSVMTWSICGIAFRIAAWTASGASVGFIRPVCQMHLTWCIVINLRLVSFASALMHQQCDHCQDPIGYVLLKHRI